MDARVQHVVAAAEDLGGPVAVVDVPVEDEHAPHPELVDRELRCDGDVVEQAEPIARDRSAWCPEGRSAANAIRASPAISALTIAHAAPLACRAAR